MLHNSPTSAGGAAIYVSKTLEYSERPDINFNYPQCEACFVEVECPSVSQNPIFGALYRHPVKDINSFTSHLGEFLEGFAVRGTKLTIMGDFNINVNNNSVPANEYMKTLQSLGFSALINQPTRFYRIEGSDHVGCPTLDYIITNSTSNITNSGILVSDVSDHLPIFASIKLSASRSNPFQNTYRRSFSDTLSVLKFAQY